MSRFSGEHIIVTGASTGIGRATALQLAGEGARVSLIARSADKLEQLVNAISAAGGQAKAFPVDVADRAGLAGAFADAAAAFGAAYGLFANAGGGGQFAPFTDFSDDNWDSLIATNLTSVFQSIRAVLPAMLEAGDGAIVVTGSLASERGMPNNAGYVASKHGVLGLARAAAAEAAPRNVRVNCILPGLIETPLLHNIGGDDIPAAMAMMAGNVPQGRVGTAEEVAEIACFLLSHAARHVTGQAWAVDGGMLGTLIPR